MQKYRRPSRWRAVGAVILGILLVLTSAATVILVLAHLAPHVWTDAPAWWPWALLVALGFMPLYAAQTSSLLGEPVASPSPLTLAFGAGAIAGWIGVLTWTGGTGWWLPAALTVLAALCAFADVKLRRGPASDRRVVAELLRTGRRVPGHIVERPGEVYEDDIDLVVGDWHVRFADHTGAHRTITTFTGFARAEAPADGTRVTVLYDHTRPDDGTRMFWALDDGHTVAAFLRTRRGPFPEPLDE